MTTLSAQVISTPLAYSGSAAGAPSAGSASAGSGAGGAGAGGRVSGAQGLSSGQASGAAYSRSVITNQMASELKSLSSALSNTARGLSVVQMADTGHKTIVDLVKQMRTLSTSMSAATSTDADRTNAQTELSRLRDLVSQTVTTTRYKTNLLLDGTYSRQLQLGTAGSDMMTVAFGSHKPGDFPTSQTLSSLDISTQAGAQTAYTVLGEALTHLDGQGIVIQAAGDRLAGTADMLTRSSKLTSAVYDRALSPDGAIAEDKQERERLFDEAASSFLARIRASSNLLPILLD